MLYGLHHGSHAGSRVGTAVSRPREEVVSERLIGY